MRKLKEGRLYKSEFLKLFDDCGNAELAKQKEQTAKHLGTIFSVQGHDSPVYLIEVSEKANRLDIEYLQSVLFTIGAVGLIIPKGLFDFVGAVVDDE